MPQIEKEIYLAVWKDRHTDDEYHAFQVLEEAIEWCDTNAKSYGTYIFSEDESILDYEWLYYLDAGDDSPKLYVRRIKLF